MLRKKNVLVTGGSGFIGSNLIEHLLNDHDVSIRATMHYREPWINDSRVEYINCDLTQIEDCRQIVRHMDLVFMCAANTSGAGVMATNPLCHVTPNVLMNTNMLSAAYEALVEKFLFISTTTVYPVSDKPVKEEDVMSGEPFEKYFCVAWMKRFCEILCEMYSTKIKNPMKTIVIRPANVYGEYDDFEWETSHVLPALIRRCVEKQNPIEVWGNGEDIKDFIYAKDLVRGMVLAMEKIDIFTHINLASGKEYCIKKLLPLIMKITNHNAEINFDISKPTMIPKRLVDPWKAKTLLGFETITSIEEGLIKTIEWYKMNKRIIYVP